MKSKLKKLIAFLQSFRVKKITVACILVALMFLSVWLVNVLFNREIWKGVIWSVQNLLPVDFDSVAATLGTEYAKLLFLSISYLASVYGFYKTPLINSLSHHFLSNFDSTTFNRLQKFTGILRWAGPQGEQKEAWDKLKNWLVGGAQGSWRSITPEVAKPFSWIVLCGPNGLGKTQLALELGKSISEGRQKPEVPLGEEPTYWQNLKHRTHCWWRRGFDQPWDVGTLMGDSDKEWGLLEKWQPRRPTLIILNDPPPAFVINYVQNLIRFRTTFRYPVRLLVIDQFEPLISEEKGIKETKAPSISMRTVEFSSEACGTSLKVQRLSEEEGFSGSGDKDIGIKALWDVKDRDVFHAQTNGWPLIVALAGC